jgi:pyruvate ferredoxin oxidoreductase delta subunit
MKDLKVIYSNLPNSKKTKWHELELGGGIVSEAGNSELYGTGNWVPSRLEFVEKNCINCSLCWSVCPDDSIIFDGEGNMIGVDLDHCKDCGLCVEICPVNKGEDKSKHALVFHEDHKEDF